MHDQFRRSRQGSYMKTGMVAIGVAVGVAVGALGQERGGLGNPPTLVFDGPLVDLTVSCHQIPPPLKARAIGGCRIPALADDLVLYYPFDEDLGGMVLDASGSGRTGMVHGATWVACGPRGGAFRFDDNSQVLTTTDTGLPAGDEPRTMAVWIKLDRLEPEGVTGLFSYGTWQWNQACGLGLDWRNNRDRFYFTQNGGVVLSARRVEPGVWRHLAYVYEGAGRHHLYVDGVPSDGMSELQGPLNTTLSGQLMLGGHPGAIGPNGGYVDEAMIFRRALTPAEVGAVYRGALPVEVVETAEGDCPRVITRIWMMKRALANAHDLPPLPVEYVESAAGDCPRVITRVWTATDRCGNSVSATQTITVVDTMAPVLQGVPPDVALECGEDIPSPPAVTAFDPDACEPVRDAVLYYPFERHYGRSSRHANVFDASGNGNHGRLAGAWVGPGGIPGLAVEFDGVDDCIRVPSSPTLMPAAVTVAAWVKIRARPAQIAVLVHKRNPDLHNNEDYVLQITSAGAARFVLAHSGWQTRLDSPPLAVGTWHHVAATFARPEMKIYLDGQLAGVARHDFPLAHNPEADLFLGASDHLVYPMGSFLAGRLDEVKIFPRALAAREIAALRHGAIPVEMTETVDGNCPGVITRVWTATDHCGNTASATQTITIAAAPGPADWFVVPDGNDSAAGNSWDTAKRTIQAAIEAASAGDTVWVGNGIYSGAGNRDLSFLGKGLTVRSLNGAEQTIVDCETAGRGFSFHAAEPPEAVLSGFTIRNGHAANGGAIFCSARPTIEHCVIVSNQVLTTTGAPFHRSGAGIYVEGAGANPTIRNCRILHNDADRIAPVPGVTANGGGIAVMSGASAWIESCEVAGNRVMYGGGGIYIEGPGVTVVNSIIQGNESAYWGGGVHCQNNATAEASRLINCLITGNTSLGVGGGIATYSGLVAENCTIHGNYGWRGGGIYSWPNARPRFLNSIVWGNTVGWAGPQYLGDESEEIFSHCCSETEVPWPGTGNRIDNPLFQNAAAGDFRLQADSPCIDAGHNAWTTMATDLGGNPRVVNGVVDMGAYEFSAPEEPMDVQVRASGMLSYPSRPDCLYTLQRCENLASGQWVNVPGQSRIRGSGGIDMLADPQPSPACFYRIQVERP